MSSEQRSPRAESRARREAAILEAGRVQLRERGAAALSLREVARTLGIASSAVYRYVESRDDLLTKLLVDAYSALADDVDVALSTVAEDTPVRRLQVLARTMRQWALAHPEQWGLIYGSPVPGYSAPHQVTTPPGVRVMGNLLGIATAATESTALTADYTHYLRIGSQQFGLDVPPACAGFAVRAWCTVVGTISMEVFGQLGPEPLAATELGESILDDQLHHLAHDLPHE